MNAPDATLSDARRNIALLLLGSFLISFSAVFVRLADVEPTASGVYRNLFGFLTLLVFVAVQRLRLWAGALPVLWALLAACFFAADIFFWHRSIIYIGPGLATIMGNFQVFVLAIVGVLVFRERATFRFVLSIPLAIIGLFLLLGGDWAELGAEYKRGLLFGVFTAITYAGYLLTLRGAGRSRRRLHPTANLVWVTFFTGTILVITGFVDGTSFTIPDTASWVWMVTYGVVCQALGWIIITRALIRVDASIAGLILLTQPTLTFIWDIVFFGRPTAPIEVFGAMLALAAIYLGSMKKSAAKKITAE